jgi:hypothetical protein
MATPYPPHTAEHPLPTSNGWGSSENLITGETTVGVRCGRCKGVFTPDLSWVDTYCARNPGADRERMTRLVKRSVVK